MSEEQFWHRPVFQNIVEITICIIMSYVVDTMLRFFINRFNSSRAEYSIYNVSKEFFTVCFSSLVLVNCIVYLIHFLKDDPVSASDLVIANIIVVLYVLLFYAIVRGNRLVRNFIEQQTQLEKLKNENLNTELKFLKSQYHPHFLFNALNTIYFQMDDDVAAAKRTVERFSELLRYQLYDQQEMVDIRREIDFLFNYIDLQKQRMSDRLRLSFEVQADMGTGKIYPLLLQPLAENAFKYAGGDYEIVMRLYKENELLVFFVRNSTDDFVRGGKRGLGLENLKRRLELLYGSAYVFSIEQGSAFFEVNLKIPFCYETD